MHVKPKKPDKREYTLMIVPHQGQSVLSVRIPIKAIKLAAASVCAVLLIMTGAFVDYRYTVKHATDEHKELQQLRQINSTQIQQIEQLAQTTAGLQEDMARLNSLDAEVRRLVNSEDLPGTSRSGTVRPGVKHNGQGGPTVQASLPEIAATVQQLQANIKVRTESLSGLRDELVARNARIAATPSIWPVSGEVTSRFGWRGSPWGGGSDYHPGIDIASDYGTPVAAAAEGTVIFAGWYGGYGKLVQIDHGNGIVTLYGHNAEFNVSLGEHVNKGQIISYMGSTGASTGPHVHYEVRVNGTAVNPANFL